MTDAGKIYSMEHMTTLEQTYCRGPVARMFNAMPNCRWLPNANNGDGTYISGRPDGEVRLLGGQAVDVECKAGLGSIFMGDPADPDNTSGWHYHQRHWWQQISIYTQTPAWIALWLYPERNPTRIYQKNARLFLVPPETWLATEAKLGGRKTLSLNASLEREHAYKTITAESEFAPFALVFEQGQWHIPASHPFWKTTLLQGEIHD
jgi:hypothetical protein